MKNINAFSITNGANEGVTTGTNRSEGGGNGSFNFLTNLIVKDSGGNGVTVK